MAEEATPVAVSAGAEEAKYEGNCRLVSNDGQEFAMTKQLASASKLCVEMFDEEDDDQELPMVEATGAQLARVVEWLKFHETNPIKAIEKPLKHDNLVELLGEWDAAFIELDGKSGLFQLTNVHMSSQCPSYSHIYVRPLILCKSQPCTNFVV